MTQIPTIRASAQARLLTYRLFAVKLTEWEERLLAALPYEWEQLLLAMNEELAKDTQRKSDQDRLIEAFAHIERSTREGLQKQMEHLTGQSIWVGTHPTGILHAFVDEHVRLIKSVKREQLDKLEFVIKRGIREGHLAKEIASNIRQTFVISKRRAQLIARNAPLQYSGALTKHNQINAGIKSYVWQSSRDERVRDSHRKFDGEIFDWSSKGPHPRTEVNCRCDAVPFLKEI